MSHPNAHTHAHAHPILPSPLPAHRHRIVCVNAAVLPTGHCNFIVNSFLLPCVGSQSNKHRHRSFNCAVCSTHTSNWLSNCLQVLAVCSPLLCMCRLLEEESGGRRRIGLSLEEVSNVYRASSYSSVYLEVSIHLIQ
jgi:hypothetical protein